MTLESDMVQDQRNIMTNYCYWRKITYWFQQRWNGAGWPDGEWHGWGWCNSQWHGKSEKPLTSICERLVNRQRVDIRVVAVILQNETVNVEERKLPITMKDNGQIFEATVFVVKGWESFVELKNILMRD